MKRLIAGVVVGLVFGLTVTAAAPFLDRNAFMTGDRSFQLGYSAGIYDALAAVNLAADVSKDRGHPEKLRPYISKWYSCLDAHTRPSLGAFKDWMVGVIETDTHPSTIQNPALLIALTCAGSLNTQ